MFLLSKPYDGKIKGELNGNLLLTVKAINYFNVAVKV